MVQVTKCKAQEPSHVEAEILQELEIITNAWTKGSENVESEMESEEAKASQMPVWPQKGQVVQVWFDRKKRSLRGRKEVEDNLIEAEQSQET